MLPTTTLQGRYYARMDVIQRSQAGDESAFAELFDQYKNLVFRTATMMLNNEREAEDVLQDVFVKVYGALESFDPEKGAFTTWLHRITVNACLNQQRKRRPESLPPAEMATARNGHTPSPERAVETDQTVRMALRALSDKLRAVVVLRYGWELTYEEIGNILDIPTGTVKSRMNAALRQMRKAVDDDPEGTPHNKEALRDWKEGEAVE